MRFLGQARKRATAALLGIAAVSIAGCGGGGSSSNGTPGTGNPTTRDRALWESKQVRSYRFTLTTHAFSPTAGQPVRVEVRDGQTVSVEPLSKDFRGNPDDLVRFGTIDKLFAVVEDAEQRGAERLEAKYDPTYGFPSDVNIDYRAAMADEEFGFEVEDFEPLN